MTSAANNAPTMVFSHPTADEDAARTKNRRRSDAAARDVAFTAPVTTGERQPRGRVNRPRNR
jgi:hypothetical protein